MFDEFQLGLYEGKMNERERIIEALRAYAGDESLISVEVAVLLINNINGENK